MTASARACPAAGSRSCVNERLSLRSPKTLNGSHSSSSSAPTNQGVRSKPASGSAPSVYRAIGLPSKVPEHEAGKAQLQRASRTCEAFA